MVAVLFGLFAAPAAALGLSETGDSSAEESADTGLPLDTSDTAEPPPSSVTDTDTGVTFCPDCLAAATLAGEPGGSPCDEGCASGGAGRGAALLPTLLAGLGLVSRRRPTPTGP